MKHFHHLTIVAVMLLTFSGAAAAQASPTVFLQSINEKLDPLVGNTQQNKGKIVKIVNKLMDFDTLCKDSLGKHWGERTAAEQKEFTKTLHALIEKNFIQRLGDTRDHNVTYESENVTGGNATVVTLVKKGDGPRAEETEISYKLRKQGKKWVVVDMVTDGISLVGNYRSQFNKIITDEGWDALMKKMKDKLAE